MDGKTDQDEDDFKFISEFLHVYNLTLVLAGGGWTTLVFFR